ncbi:MATE family efflux transporter [Limnohabitans sp. T6-5]|uniref:MATE family efflux transporter n=1 Tax=Limnohabitans sp. T6-5 TaxID=1100724 RepID=UPI000D3789BA|nr:MATE family efflux transporter [Limnohabitans sp. T6-5]PUE06947.1 MATE family efflux transporter [Limnohabitans sp. T6-5]
MTELRTIARHAGTVLVGQLAVMAFGVADTLIAGRYSPHALAVLSLASSIYISIYVALNGMLQALLPVWAELHGARRHAEIGPSFRQALYICAGATATGFCALWFPDPWLSWTDVPADLWPDVRAYLRVLALALVPSQLFRMYSTLNQSLGYPRLVTWLQAGALLVKVPLSFALTFGLAGLTGLGVVGCAWATLCVNTLMMLTGLWMLRTQDIYSPYRLWRRLEMPHWHTLRRFLQLGLPAGLSIMVEVTSFTLMALFIARLGAAASASHQIAANVASVLYMVPLALGIASSARTGYWLGARQPGKARHAAGLGIGLAVGAAALCAGLLMLGRHRLAQAYTNNPEVAQAATVWLAWVALYHLADAVQAVCAFLLRCYRITLAPLLIYTTLLWGAGLYGGYQLAYQGLGVWAARPSVDSFWITSTAALGLVSALFAWLVW